MKKLIIILLLASASVSAETLRGGYGACTSADLFDQFVSAQVKNDKPALNYLLGSGCIVTRGGITVTVMDMSWTGTTKVRAYVGDKSVVLWTNTENVSK